MKMFVSWNPSIIIIIIIIIITTIIITVVAVVQLLLSVTFSSASWRTFLSVESFSFISLISVFVLKTLISKRKKTEIVGKFLICCNMFNIVIVSRIPLRWCWLLIGHLFLKRFCRMYYSDAQSENKEAKKT